MGVCLAGLGGTTGMTLGVVGVGIISGGADCANCGSGVWFPNTGKTVGLGSPKSGSNSGGGFLLKVFLVVMGSCGSFMASVLSSSQFPPLLLGIV